jgi:hypothetical protein
VVNCLATELEALDGLQYWKAQIDSHYGSGSWDLLFVENADFVTNLLTEESVQASEGIKQFFSELLSRIDQILKNNLSVKEDAKIQFNCEGKWPSDEWDKHISI